MAPVSKTPQEFTENRAWNEAHTRTPHTHVTHAHSTHPPFSPSTFAVVLGIHASRGPFPSGGHDDEVNRAVQLVHLHSVHAQHAAQKGGRLCLEVLEVAGHDFQKLFHLFVRHRLHHVVAVRGEEKELPTVVSVVWRCGW